jgi:PTS system mannose-specific IIB component
VPRLRAALVVVADDEAAQSPLAKAAMTLALPPGVDAEVLAVGEVDFAALAAAPDTVLLLFREVAGVERAAGYGLTPTQAPRVNLGNVHYAPGRKPITPSVFLSEAEVAAVRALGERGFAVEARAVPAEAPVGPEEIERRYRAAG